MTDQNETIKKLQEQIDLLMKVVPQEDLKRLRYKNKPTGTDIAVSFYRNDKTMTKKIVKSWKMLINDPYIDPVTKKPIDNQTIRVFFHADQATEDKMNRLKNTIEKNSEAIREMQATKSELFEDKELKLAKDNYDIAEEELRMVNEKLKTARGDNKKTLEEKREEIGNDSREKHHLYKEKLGALQKESEILAKAIEAKVAESQKFVEDLQKLSGGTYVDLDYKTFGTRAIEKQSFTIKEKKVINDKDYYVIEYEGRDIEIDAQFIN